MVDDPGDGLGGRELGREDRVALVLPSLVVGDEHGAAGAQRVEDLLHRCERHQATAAGTKVSIRCTWRAITSVSMFTRPPTPIAPSVVASSVSGMRLTSNQWPSSSRPIAETVSETPATVIEPLSTTSGARSSGSRKRSTRQEPSSRTAITGRGAVDVALHDVSAQPLVGGDGALEVDPVAGLHAHDGRGLVERLLHDVGGPLHAVVSLTTVRQQPLTAMEIAKGGPYRQHTVELRLDREPRSAVDAGLRPRATVPELLDDSGEHLSGLSG